VDLSVIVPAYNEETRLPLMLDECLEFLGRTS
jgi:glycosyltransferase involved in cell wall biosynthesis